MKTQRLVHAASPNTLRRSIDRRRLLLSSLGLGFALANAAIFLAHPGRTGAGFAEMERELEQETRELQSLIEPVLQRVLQEFNLGG